MTDYFRITEWAKFQHYKKRNPPWVKLYSWVLDDDDFDCLPDDSKLLFFCLLPFASRRANQIKLDFKWLQKKLPIGKKITKETLQPLVDVGFIECYQDDSKVIATGKQDATPETETETEKRQSATTKAFIPPTQEEVIKYVTDNPELSNVDPVNFWKSFNDGGWIDTRGNKVRNWKLKLRTWSNYGNDRRGTQGGNSKADRSSFAGQESAYGKTL